MKPFAIQSKRVIISGDSPPAPAAIRVENGKISAILPHGAGGADVIDAGDSVVMPGIVDTHAHINEPGRTEWEGFRTATRAAAAGGITTVIDMPLNSIPPTTTRAALEAKAAAAQGHCTIDYGFWGGVIPGNTGELRALIDAGVMGFKAFMIESGVDEFPMSREKDLREAMLILARGGAPLLFHAELDNGDGHIEGDPRAYRGYLNSRPQRFEVDAVRLVIKLVRETGCRAHIVHLSAADALIDLAKARGEGLPITVETCPHYLTFNSEEIPSGATHYKCAPPIREKTNRERLWRALVDGDIDFVVSDHSPCTPALKRLEEGDFGRAWGGIAGLQFSMPAVWTGMRERNIPLHRLVGWMCNGTAKFLGLEKRKGSLAVGCDADMVIWNPDRSYVLTEAMVEHRHHLTPYTGRTLFGTIEKTFVRGNCVYDAGNFPEKHEEQCKGMRIK